MSLALPDELLLLEERTLQISGIGAADDAGETQLPLAGGGYGEAQA